MLTLFFFSLYQQDFSSSFGNLDHADPAMVLATLANWATLPYSFNKYN